MRITRRKAVFTGLATLGVAALLAGCGQAPETTTPSGNDTEGTVDALPCMVSDAGGFDDRSFNQLGLAGLQAGAEELGVEEIHVESQSDTDYAPNIESLVDQGCTTIVTVGFLLAEATAAAAEANPDINFAIVDDSSIALDNVQPIVFDTAQAAFLAGYAAASHTETGIVATWGGMNIPPVTIFMDGFVDGVAYYNEEHGTSVVALGWDVAAQDGSFVGSFTAGTEAKAMAQSFIDQGADVLLPVGGPIFISAAEAIRDAGEGAGISLIGVDADLYETAPDFSDLFLTSILKKMDEGVHAAVVAAGNGEFSNAPYVGTLENGGVALAPFHDFSDTVDPNLQAELDTIAAAIISGDIQVESPSSPATE